MKSVAVKQLSNMFLQALFVLTISSISFGANLEEIFAWKEMEFNWPSLMVRDQSMRAGDYIPENNLPLGLERWRNKLFVTVPRWKAGVASSLNYVPLEPLNKTAALTPYPNWEANTLPKGRNQMQKENTIVSVFRVRVDDCDRLWVMDTGLADVWGGARAYSKPALVIFDLNTDTLIRRYEFKNTDFKENSFFANVVVDVSPGKCNEAYAYVPDLGDYAVVIYSFAENNSWRAKHNFFHMDPLRGDLNVGGVNFQWTDGVFGLALSAIQPDGFRTVYFHSLVGTKEFSVSTRVWKNMAVATDGESSYFKYKIEGERGNDSQSSASDIDQNSGVLFLTQLIKDGVACWDTKLPLNSDNVAIIAQDKEKLIFPNDLKVDKEQNLYILSDKMPIFLYKKLNRNEINYRIFRVKVADAIKGTVCERH